LVPLEQANLARHDLRNGVSDGFGERVTQDALGGRVEVYYPVLRVQNDYSVPHALNDHVTRHRHEIQRPVAEKWGREDHPGYSES
jgi:hypothetical protein